MLQRALLLCGIASPLLYAVADALAGLRWEGYSFRDQTISEPGAIGAPSRPLFSILLVPVYALLIGFGVGIWQAAAGARNLRVSAGLIVGLGVLALAVGQFVPMRPRGVEQGLTGALHLIEGAVAMLVVFDRDGLRGVGAWRPFSRLHRRQSQWCWHSARGLAWRLPGSRPACPPWVGVKERIFWYAYQLWFAVLGGLLLRHQATHREAR